MFLSIKLKYYKDGHNREDQSVIYLYPIQHLKVKRNEETLRGRIVTVLTLTL